MSECEGKAPAHQRLGEMSVKHLVRVLKACAGGSIGFDPYRDERTADKSKLVAYLLATYTPAQIDAAHEQVWKAYKDMGGKRGWRRNRVENKVEGDGDGNKIEQVQVPPLPPPIVGSSESPPQQIPPPVISVGGNDQLAALQALLKILGVGAIDESKVRAIVDAAIAQSLDGIKAQLGVRRIEVVTPPSIEVKNLGVQHRNFDLLLKACNARDPDGHRLNVWLAGPAGTGKTTAAKAVAKALGLKFVFNGALDTSYKLSGFRTASGDVVRTPFREAWEHGGVYLFDEVDASAPSAVLEFNAALANGVYAFPDAVIERHKDCVIIAGANTAGVGGTSEYVGRQKQDAAFLDRFAYIDWPLDEQLERAISGNPDWTTRVQSVRSKIKTRGIRGTIITPRASIYGASLLAAGLNQEQVERMVLKKGLTDEQWSQVKA